MKYRHVVIAFFLHLSQDKYIEISSLPWMNWDQVFAHIC